MILNTNTLINKIILFNQLDESQIDQLLNPKTLEICQDKIVDKIISKFENALDNKERVFICGDYDSDGLCSTSILVKTLRKKGIDCGFYIPNRFKDGYGISVNIAQMVIDKNYDLFVLLDNGVSAFDVIDLIHENKKEVIVIDHHEITEKVKADYLLHPDVLSDEYKAMCTSGLVHLISHKMMGYDPYACALAAIATIGDMMPLWNYNRTLLIHGLKEMNQHHFLQLSQLLKQPNDLFDEEVLAFQIVPKINAVGRLADIANPNRVVDYLCLEDSADIMNFSLQINSINEQRKNIHQVMTKKAHTMISNEDVIMVYDESFHEGVVGITAGQLANFYQKVSIVMHDDGKRLKGSVRSYGGIHLRELFEPGLHLVSKYGGHGAAAGIEIQKEQFEEFKQLVNDNFINVIKDEEVIDSIEFDTDLINVENVKSLKNYAPYGMGFKIPSVRLNHVEIISIKKMKSGRKIVVLFKGKRFDVLDFGAHPKSIREGDFIDLLARFTLNEFRGVESITLFAEKIN